MRWKKILISSIIIFSLFLGVAHSQPQIFAGVLYYDPATNSWLRYTTLSSQVFAQNIPQVQEFVGLYVYNLLTNTWIPATSSSFGSPAGANTQIQFNDAGVFGGNANFTFNKTTNNVTLGAGQLLLPNGLLTAPSLAFTLNPNTGFYSDGGGGVIYSSGGVPKIYFNASGLFYASNAFFAWGDDPNIMAAGAYDVRLYRDATNTLALKNGNADQTQRWYGANGAYFQVKTVSELLTIGAAASTDTTMDIPVNATVQGVAVRVVTVIPTAATFTVTGATSTTVFDTAAVSTAAGSTDVGNANCPYKNGAAQKIRITPDLIPAAATGQVRIILMFTIPSAPTS